MPRFALAVLVMAVLTTPAMPYCWEPSFNEDEPDPPGTYRRPSVPYCLRDYKWSRRHTCDSWEIDRYQREVEDYIDDVNTYIGEANDLA